jgi:hypothetical protein
MQLTLVHDMALLSFGTQRALVKSHGIAGVIPLRSHRLPNLADTG